MEPLDLGLWHTLGVDFCRFGMKSCGLRSEAIRKVGNELVGSTVQREVLATTRARAAPAPPGIYKIRTRKSGWSLVISLFSGLDPPPKNGDHACRSRKVSMDAPDNFVAWLTAHEHLDPVYGWVYRYHSRSDAHSIALCKLIVADLVDACPTFVSRHWPTGLSMASMPGTSFPTARRRPSIWPSARPRPSPRANDWPA